MNNRARLKAYQAQNNSYWITPRQCRRMIKKGNKRNDWLDYTNNPQIEFAPKGYVAKG